MKTEWFTKLISQERIERPRGQALHEPWHIASDLARENWKIQWKVMKGTIYAKIWSRKRELKDFGAKYLPSSSLTSWSRKRELKVSLANAATILFTKTADLARENWKISVIFKRASDVIEYSSRKRELKVGNSWPRLTSLFHSTDLARENWKEWMLNFYPLFCYRFWSRKRELKVIKLCYRR